MKTKEKASDKYPLYSNPIEAGFPSIAEDAIEDRLNINDYIVSHVSMESSPLKG